MSEKQQAFWMVLGSGSPTYRHTSKESADTEAKRLARLNPDQWFFVLEAIGAYRKSDLVSINLRDDDNFF